jgi:hypothetical protein
MAVPRSRTAELSWFSDSPAAQWHGLAAREDTAKPVPSEVEGMAVPQVGSECLQRDFRPEISGRNLLHKLTRDALLKKGLMTATKRQLNLTE